MKTIKETAEKLNEKGIDFEILNDSYIKISLDTSGADEFSEAYNFSKHIFGYGDDMRDWENDGDFWVQCFEIWDDAIVIRPEDV